MTTMIKLVGEKKMAGLWNFHGAYQLMCWSDSSGMCGMWVSRSSRNCRRTCCRCVSSHHSWKFVICPPYRCCVQKNWRILRVRQMPCNGSTWWHECWMSPMGGMRPGGKVRSLLLVLTQTANESVNLMVEPSRFLSQYPTYALQLQQATFHTQLHQCRRDLHSTVTKKHRPQFIWTTRLGLLHQLPLLPYQPV